MKFHETSTAETILPAPDVLYLEDDAARLDVLESFAPDALEDDPELSAITAFAAKLTGMPIAQVTLVEEERQRFLAGEGLDVKETPRDVSFCDHAMRSNRLMDCLLYTSPSPRD